MLVACLKFMLQDDVREMLYANEYPNRFEEEAVNTPAHMSPACETYWSM